MKNHVQTGISELKVDRKLPRKSSLEYKKTLSHISTKQFRQILLRTSGNIWINFDSARQLSTLTNNDLNDVMNPELEYI